VDELNAISTPQPEFSDAAASLALASEFGLRGTLVPLLSERDQNFRLTADDGRRFVFKIANRAEAEITTDFQIKALLHIERQGCPVATPVLQRTLAGDESALIVDGDVAHVCRVVSYLPGVLRSGVDTTPELAMALGRCAAQLDLALADFRHAGADQALLWDLQRASELRELLPYIPETELRTAIASCLDDFDERALPALPSLRRQVIHADLHGDNVLVDKDQHDAISGVIDFGDMVHAPLIAEVAIAAAYLRVVERDRDALLLITSFVAGFNKVLPLQEAELELLFDLVRARLAATISILRWRAASRGADDEYARDYLQSERGAEAFLQHLATLGRRRFTERVQAACHP
jgi:hydroxylysine kinase